MELYEGREPYIFISYARKDWKRVEPYLNALSGAGYRVWYDKGIQAGADWLDTLLEKVENCEVFCPLFSEAFTDSRYCYVETEWAHRKQKNIVPLHLEEMKQDGIPRLYQLLQGRQDLRLYQFDSPAQFAKRLGRERVFKPCKVPPEPRKTPSAWNKVGQIQWRLDADDVLKIAANEDMLSFGFYFGSIPSYLWDTIQNRSTAPWALYREKIVSVEISDNIDAIGDFAFQDCENLTKALIGNRVTKIGDRAFSHCQSLTNMRIPDSVTEIGDLAFHSCISLKNVRIPDSVTEIGDFAFWGCENLKSVEIPAGLEIDEFTFPDHTLITRRDAPQRR